MYCIPEHHLHNHCMPHKVLGKGLKYLGTKSTYADLPTTSDIGDTWLVLKSNWTDQFGNVWPRPYQLYTSRGQVTASGITFPMWNAEGEGITINPCLIPEFLNLETGEYLCIP